MADRRARASLDDSLRRAAALTGVAWQAVAIWVVLVTDPARPRWHLLLAHLVIGALALLLLRGRRYILPVGLAFYVTWCYDFSSAPSVNGALCLAACWLGNLIHVGAALLLRGWLAVACPIVAATAGSVVASELNPAWETGLTSGNIVTATTIAIGGKLAMRYLGGVVDDADDMADQVQRERQATTLVTRAARAATDHARLLHDTVINTLGAVANGGAGVDDVALVRRRCRQDLEAVGVVLDGAESSARSGLADVDGEGRISVRRTGMDEDAVAQLEARLPDEVIGALTGAVRELVRNAAKHAGVDRVDLDVRASGGRQLVVAVTDDGAGFDGRIPAGRGLANSVVARLAEVGASVEVRSVPAEGTRVTITCPLDAPGAPVEDPAPDGWPGAEALIGRIRWGACWSWTAAVVVIGVVIEAVNRPGLLSATYLMLAVVAVASTIAWWSSRGDRVAPTWCLALLVVAVPAAFEAGMAGVGFGNGAVFYYQAWGVTPLLVALLTLGRRRAAFVAGVVLLAVTAVLTTVLVGQASGAAVAAVVVVGVAPALGLAFGWLGFHVVIARILHGADEDRRRALELRVEAAARAAETGVRKRWRAAELRDAVGVLRGLADGALDPGDPQVRRRCGVEEAYIRQLIQLSPDAFRMGPSLARALAAAHARSVTLSVRTGSVDAPDEATAETLGAVVDDAVRAVPPGGSMTIGVFGRVDHALLTMVAPAPHLGDRIGTWGIPEDGWKVVRETFEGQELIEITWPATPPRAATGRVGGRPGGSRG